jgi:hypothetical protein
MRNLKIGKQANGKTKMNTGQCPLSSIKGPDGKYLRKIRIDGDCFDPTTANQRRKGSKELDRQRMLEAKAQKAKKNK